MQLIFLIYIILPIILLYGAGFSKKGSWNDGFLSLSQSKALQGICVLIIVFHHISHKVYINDSLPELIKHSLDPFVNAGYLMTAVFFFFNGYGLYKSYINKPGYLDHFLVKRLTVPIVAYYLTGYVFLAIRLILGDRPGIKMLLLFLSGIVHCNPYSWYMVILIIFYLVFYLVFKNAKSEKAAVIAFTALTLLYMIIGLLTPRNRYFMRGEWWYNSVFMIPLGMILARHEGEVLAHVKRNYGKYLLLHLALIVPAFKLSAMALEHFGYFNDVFPYGAKCKLISLLSQMLCVYLLVGLILLLGMKVSIGNRVLSFLGKYTLEIYLIHGIFVEVFDHEFAGMLPPIPSPLPVSNPLTYTILIILATLPLSLLLGRIEKWAQGLFLV